MIDKGEIIYSGMAVFISICKCFMKEQRDNPSGIWHEIER